MAEREEGPPPAQRRGLRESTLGIIFLSPATILMLLFLGIPVAYAVALSFQKYDLRASRDSSFDGLGNYADLVESEDFRNSVGVTVRFSVVVILVSVGLSLLFALALRERFRGSATVRVALLLPWAVSPVIAGMMWKHLFHQQYGLINALLLKMGLIDSYFPFFAKSNWALFIAGLGTSWRWIPLFTIILLAGMQAVPESLYRAARMDGAGPFRQFTDVTFPAIRGLFGTVALLSLIVAIESFDLIYSMTGGGPGFATSPLNYLTYVEGFERLNLGGSAALGVLLTLMILSISALALAATRLGRSAAQGRR